VVLNFWFGVPLNLSAVDFPGACTALVSGSEVFRIQGIQLGFSADSTWRFDLPGGEESRNQGLAKLAGFTSLPARRFQLIRDSGLGFQLKVLKTFLEVPSLLDHGAGGTKPGTRRVSRVGRDVNSGKPIFLAENGNENGSINVLKQ